MNCNYRILKDVHIGVSVRKTKGHGTLPFSNEPMAGVKLESWTNQGFNISHPALPRSVWVDFDQLPLNQIVMDRGIIQTPITFVEEIRKGGRMVLVRADTLDYSEMVHDKVEKDATKKYAVRDLKPGERVISAICKEGNVMVYLGTFTMVTYNYKYDYSHYRDNNGYYYYIDEAVDRAFFLYEHDKGHYSLQFYPVGNKVVKENYKCSDRGQEGIAARFTDLEQNLQLVKDIVFTKGHTYRYRDLSKRDELRDFSINGGDYKVCFFQKNRENAMVNAFTFVKENFNVKERFFANQDEMQKEYSRTRSYR